jgi:hypothetical protein
MISLFMRGRETLSRETGLILLRAYAIHGCTRKAFHIFWTPGIVGLLLIVVRTKGGLQRFD